MDDPPALLDESSFPFDDSSESPPWLLLSSTFSHGRNGETNLVWLSFGLTGLSLASAALAAEDMISIVEGGNTAH